MKTLAGWLAGAAVLASLSDAGACSVPVFRYALERWPADSYGLVLFHRGPLGPDDRSVADALLKASEDGWANLLVRMVDLDGTNAPAEKDLPKGLNGAKLPFVLLQDPGPSGLRPPVWEGTLTAEFARRLLDSPARRELARRLMKGDSVVWVLVESGDPVKDDEAAKLLDTEIRRLESISEVPEVDPDDPRTQGNPSLKIAFSSLRVSRADAAEELFIRQLTSVDTPPAGAEAPVVFPVFGRGRVLCGLTGKQFDGETFEEVAAFLTGACSCEVKSMNPGLDLLIAADWDAVFEGREAQEPELPLVGLSTLAGQALAATGTAVTAAVAAPAPQRPLLVRSLVAVAALGLVAVLGGSLWLRRRGRRA